MRNKEKRGVSAGTIFMLTLTVCVLVSVVYILPRLSSGSGADISSVRMQVLSIRDGHEQILEETEADTGTSVATARTPDGVSVTPEPQYTAPARSFTLTAGGTIAVEEGIRKSGYSAETKKYDFSDISGLLRGETKADINVVFLENILYDDVKYTANTVPVNAVSNPGNAGFDTVAAGFHGAWEQGREGITETAVTLTENGMDYLGIRPDTDESAVHYRTVNGIKTAMLQYTDTVPAATRKKMEKENAAGAIPDLSPEAAAADIAEARENGAQVVIVFLNWGKVGAKEPDKEQKQLAQRIADAGADLIIGAGSRVAQTAEYLSSRGADGNTRKVLCIYSLGTLLGENRKNTNRLGGYLANLSVSVDEDGIVTIDRATYTPDYIWHYRQDGRDCYRCIAPDRAPPDGMDADNTKAMGKLREFLQKVLDGTPLTAR